MKLFLLTFLLSSWGLSFQNPGVSEKLYSYHHDYLIDPTGLVEKLEGTCNTWPNLSIDWFYCHYLVGRAEAEKANSKKALTIFSQLIGNEELKKYPKIRILVLGGLGLAYEFDGQLEKAESHHNRAMELAGQLGDSWYIALTNNYTAWYYSRKGYDSDAATYLDYAFQQSKISQDQVLIHEVLNNVGSALTHGYSETRAKEGIAILEKSLQFFEEQNYYYYVGTLGYNIGLAYAGMDLEKAIHYHDICYRYAKKINDLSGMAYALYGKGYSHLRQVTVDENVEHYKIAIRFLEPSHQLFAQLDNTLFKVETQRLLFTSYIGAGMVQEAVKILPKLEAVLLEGNSFLDLYDFYTFKAELYQQLNQPQKTADAFRNALHYYQKYMDRENSEKFNELTAKLSLNEKEFRYQILEKQSLIQKEHLEKQQERMKFVAMIAFAAIIIAFALLSIYGKERVINRQRTGLARILHNIKDGILTLDDQLKIEQEYSAYLSRLLPDLEIKEGEAFIGPFLSLTDYDEDFKKIIFNIIYSSIGEDSLFWDINAIQLPSEAHLSSNIVTSISWQPIFDREHKIHKILISLRDITAENVLKSERDRLKSMHKKVLSILYCNKSDVLHLLEQISQLTSMSPEQVSQERPQIEDRLHKLKGQARIMKLKDLAEIVHGLEDLLVKNAWSKSHIDALQVSKTYREYRSAIDLFKDATLMQENKPLESAFSHIVADAKERLLSRYSDCRIEIHESFDCWNFQVKDIMEVLLLHSLSNSVDHGFFRTQLTETIPHIKISATLKQSHLHYELTDNGAGLDLQKLSQLAEDHQYTYSSEFELSQIVFERGISSQSLVSLTSGRGVGLATLRDLGEQYNGQVVIKNLGDTTSGICLSFHCELDTPKAANTQAS